MGLFIGGSLIFVELSSGREPGVKQASGSAGILETRAREVSGTSREILHPDTSTDQLERSLLVEERRSDNAHRTKDRQNWSSGDSGQMSPC